LLELQPELAICTIAGTAASWTGSSSSKIDKQLEAILSQHPTTVSAPACERGCTRWARSGWRSSWERLRACAGAWRAPHSNYVICMIMVRLGTR